MSPSSKKPYICNDVLQGLTNRSCSLITHKMCYPQTMAVSGPTTILKLIIVLDLLVTWQSREQ